MDLILPLMLIVISCIVIWRAGDGFMVASEYIGRNLSEGVRGASINAIASSMPEVFTSFFFLFGLKDAEGFSGGIGTTAGSAIFNSMVIPAVAILTVTSMGLVKKVRLSKKVILRDGISLIIIEAIFLILISGAQLDWYHGLILIGMYMAYVTYMFSSMKKRQETSQSPAATPPEQTTHEHESHYKSVKTPLLKCLFTINLKHLFVRNQKITASSAWVLLTISTLLIALVCYFLVLACEWIGAETYTVPYLGEFHGLNIPLMFIALILASAASSFPDTIISIKDAQKGKYDDALSNALGSNIFDVCFALGFPLFLFCLFYGPIQMSPENIALSSEIRLLLLLLTVLVVVIFAFSPHIGRFRALILLSIYFLFVAYIVGRGMDNAFTNTIAEQLVAIVRFITGHIYGGS